MRSVVQFGFGLIELARMLAVHGRFRECSFGPSQVDRRVLGFAEHSVEILPGTRPPASVGLQQPAFFKAARRPGALLRALATP